MRACVLENVRGGERGDGRRSGGEGERREARECPMGGKLGRAGWRELSSHGGQDGTGERQRQKRRGESVANKTKEQAYPPESRDADRVQSSGNDRDQPHLPPARLPGRLSPGSTIKAQGLGGGGRGRPRAGGTGGKREGAARESNSMNDDDKQEQVKRRAVTSATRTRKGHESNFSVTKETESEKPRESIAGSTETEAETETEVYVGRERGSGGQARECPRIFGGEDEGGRDDFIFMGDRKGKGRAGQRNRKRDRDREYGEERVKREKERRRGERVALRGGGNKNREQDTTRYMSDNNNNNTWHTASAAAAPTRSGPLHRRRRRRRHRPRARPPPEPALPPALAPAPALARRGRRRRGRERGHAPRGRVRRGRGRQGGRGRERGDARARGAGRADRRRAHDAGEAAEREERARAEVGARAEELRDAKMGVSVNISGGGENVRGTYEVRAVERGVRVRGGGGRRGEERERGEVQRVPRVRGPVARGSLPRARVRMHVRDAQRIRLRHQNRRRAQLVPHDVDDALALLPAARGRGAHGDAHAREDARLGVQRVRELREREERRVLLVQRLRRGRGRRRGVQLRVGGGGRLGGVQARLLEDGVRDEREGEERLGVVVAQDLGECAERGRLGLGLGRRGGCGGGVGGGRGGGVARGADEGRGDEEQRAGRYAGDSAIPGGGRLEREERRRVRGVGGRVRGVLLEGAGVEDAAGLLLEAGEELALGGDAGLDPAGEALGEEAAAREQREVGARGGELRLAELGGGEPDAGAGAARLAGEGLLGEVLGVGEPAGAETGDGELLEEVDGEGVALGGGEAAAGVAGETGVEGPVLGVRDGELLARVEGLGGAAAVGAVRGVRLAQLGLVVVLPDLGEELEVVSGRGTAESAGTDLQDGVDALAAERLGGAWGRSARTQHGQDELTRGAARGEEGGDGLGAGVDLADELGEGGLVEGLDGRVEGHPAVGREGDVDVLDADVAAVWGREGRVGGVRGRADALGVVRVNLGGCHGYF
ncbi:hypothetical protein JB92DRAFT_3100755 [Gautieria morchelliformis]|nr:hypothetical protein JB92DRAFT_3100755 [Gautieria morchelliformis]